MCLFLSSKAFSELKDSKLTYPLMIVEIEYSYFKVKALIFITKESENN